jgi:hypothetical protein
MGLFAGRGRRDIFLGLLKGYDGQGRMKEFIMERDKENGWLFVSFHDSFGKRAFVHVWSLFSDYKHAHALKNRSREQRKLAYKT